MRFFRVFRVILFLFLCMANACKTNNSTLKGIEILDKTESKVTMGVLRNECYPIESLRNIEERKLALEFLRKIYKGHALFTLAGVIKPLSIQDLSFSFQENEKQKELEKYRRIFKVLQCDPDNFITMFLRTRESFPKGKPIRYYSWIGNVQYIRTELLGWGPNLNQLGINKDYTLSELFRKIQWAPYDSENRNIILGFLLGFPSHATFYFVDKDRSKNINAEANEVRKLETYSTLYENGIGAHAYVVKKGSSISVMEKIQKERSLRLIESFKKNVMFDTNFLKNLREWLKGPNGRYSPGFAKNN